MANSTMPLVDGYAAPVGPVRPKMPSLRTLKTFNLPQQHVDEVLMSASSMLPTPTSEILGGHPLRILIAPSGFKESLGPEQVADAIEAGVRKVLDRNSVILRKLPLHDGGEGFARALVAAHGGVVSEMTVTGPIGVPVASHLGFLGVDQKTAVLDMAAAAGLRLVPKDSRDPTITTTYGVGELIRKALDAGSTKIIIGCGDSGTSDGGAGMLQALGVRLLDSDGEELPRAGGGQSLTRLDRICWHDVHPRLRKDAGKCIELSSTAYTDELFREQSIDRSNMQHQECSLRPQRCSKSIWSPEGCHSSASGHACSRS